MKFEDVAPKIKKAVKKEFGTKRGTIARINFLSSHDNLTIYEVQLTKMAYPIYAEVVVGKSIKTTIRMS